MPALRKDRTGQRFSRLVVQARASRKDYWICLCDCGTVKEIMMGNLLAERGIKSCGCLAGRGPVPLTPEERVQRRRERYTKKRDILCEKARTKYHENPEPIRANVRQWRKDHPEIARDTARRGVQKFRLTHPDRFRAQTQGVKNRRRAAQANAPLNDLTTEQWWQIQVAQDHRCCYCGKRRKGKLTQDHITPISKGGSHTLHNVVAACSACNSRKGNRAAPIPVQPLLLTLPLTRKTRKAA